MLWLLYMSICYGCYICLYVMVVQLNVLLGLLQVGEGAVSDSLSAFVACYAWFD